MAVEQGKNKSKNTKYTYGNNYRRNRTGTDFDTITLANELKHKVTMYVMNEKYVPKKWRYFNGKPAVDYARAIRDCVSMANDIWLDNKIPDEGKKSKRGELQAKALSYCNILQQQLIDICEECDGANDDNMRDVVDTLSNLIGKIIKWNKSDNDRAGK
jgi:hypothetical protein|nr:MAG TPA: hypothetical protein [Caudoviricetes sp.]